LSRAKAVETGRSGQHALGDYSGGPRGAATSPVEAGWRPVEPVRRGTVPDRQTTHFSTPAPHTALSVRGPGRLLTGAALVRECTPVVPRSRPVSLSQLDPTRAKRVAASVAGSQQSWRRRRRAGQGGLPDRLPLVGGKRRRRACRPFYQKDGARAGRAAWAESLLRESCRESAGVAGNWAGPAERLLKGGMSLCSSVASVSGP
jgi:hypothetical protein